MQCVTRNWRRRRRSGTCSAVYECGAPLPRPGHREAVLTVFHGSNATRPRRRAKPALGRGAAVGVVPRPARGTLSGHVSRRATDGGSQPLAGVSALIGVGTGRSGRALVRSHLTAVGTLELATDIADAAARQAGDAASEVAPGLRGTTGAERRGLQAALRGAAGILRVSRAQAVADVEPVATATRPTRVAAPRIRLAVVEGLRPCTPLVRDPAIVVVTRVAANLTAQRRRRTAGPQHTILATDGIAPRPAGTASLRDTGWNTIAPLAEAGPLGVRWKAGLPTHAIIVGITGARTPRSTVRGSLSLPRGQEDGEEHQAPDNERHGKTLPILGWMKEWLALRGQRGCRTAAQLADGMHNRVPAPGWTWAQRQSGGHSVGDVQVLLQT
jgi:hypothetical protein